MIKGEGVLIERAANGFVVTPKEITGLTKSGKDVFVFETSEGLEGFLRGHFVKEEGGKVG